MVPSVRKVLRRNNRSEGSQRTPVGLALTRRALFTKLLFTVQSSKQRTWRYRQQVLIFEKRDGTAEPVIRFLQVQAI
jgi:hypothetical protein